jgi:hypothetical protein
VLCLATAVLAVGCGDGPSETSRSDSFSAYTVESGDRFVVSADPEHIVLKKEVDGAKFPFNEKSLEGKAILIHPVVARADDGVYARATEVRSEGDNYVIDAKPLTLAEMGSITEDEIVRIYIDAKRSAKRQQPDDGVLKPEMLRPLDAPMEMNGIAFTGFDFGSGVDFASPVFLRPGVAFKHTIETVSLEPEVFAGYTSEGGLELGFRGSFEWKSKLVLSGRVAGEFFKSPTMEGPPLVVFVPIGVVPVPISIRGSAWVTCVAAITGLANVNVAIEASASIGASLRAKPSLDEAPSNWVTEGSWPAAATGTADVTPTVDTPVGASVSCAIPRLEVHAAVAGVAGPYLAMAPTATINDHGATFDTKLIAGVGAGLLGIGSGVEVVLYTWKP